MSGSAFISCPGKDPPVAVGIERPKSFDGQGASIVLLVAFVSECTSTRELEELLPFWRGSLTVQGRLVLLRLLEGIYIVSVCAFCISDNPDNDATIVSIP